MRVPCSWPETCLHLRTEVRCLPEAAMSAIVVWREWLQPALYWGSAMASALRIVLLQPARVRVRTRL